MLFENFLNDEFYNSSNNVKRKVPACKCNRSRYINEDDSLEQLKKQAIAKIEKTKEKYLKEIKKMFDAVESTASGMSSDDGGSDVPYYFFNVKSGGIGGKPGIQVYAAGILKCNSILQQVKNPNFKDVDNLVDGIIYAIEKCPKVMNVDTNDFKGVSKMVFLSTGLPDLLKSDKWPDEYK